MFRRTKGQTSSAPTALAPSNGPDSDLEHINMSQFEPEVLCAALSPSFPSLSQGFASPANKACIKAVRFASCQMLRPGSFSVELRDQPNGRGSVLQRRTGVSCKDMQAHPLTVTFAPPRPQLKPASALHLAIQLEDGEFLFELGSPGATDCPPSRYAFAVADKGEAWTTTDTNGALHISFKFT